MMMNDHLPTEVFSASEVAELDRYTIENLGVDLTQLMEVAGMRSAEKLVEIIGEGKRVVVLAGRGGNGGDALVCAKWLKLWGYEITVLLSHPEEKLRDITQHQLKVWRSFNGTVTNNPPDDVDAIVDGILGYSIAGDPRGKAAELIEWANGTRKPILALDGPSGLDLTLGKPGNPCIKAQKTVVYGVMKKGIIEKTAKEYVGEVELVDIGFPRTFPMYKNKF